MRRSIAMKATRMPRPRARPCRPARQPGDGCGTGSAPGRRIVDVRVTGRREPRDHSSGRVRSCRTAGSRYETPLPTVSAPLASWCVSNARSPPRTAARTLILCAARGCLTRTGCHRHNSGHNPKAREWMRAEGHEWFMLDCAGMAEQADAADLKSEPASRFWQITLRFRSLIDISPASAIFHKPYTVSTVSGGMWRL